MLQVTNVLDHVAQAILVEWRSIPLVFFSLLLLPLSLRFAMLFLETPLPYVLFIFTVLSFLLGIFILEFTIEYSHLMFNFFQ